MREISIIGQDILFDGIKVAVMVLPEQDTTLRSEFIWLLSNAEDEQGRNAIINEATDTTHDEGYKEGCDYILKEARDKLNEIQDVERALQILNDIEEALPE